MTLHDFSASVDDRELSEGRHEIGGLEVRTMLLSHPGTCLGYRLTHGGRSICYVTDNELFSPGSELYSEEYVEHLADFARGLETAVLTRLT